LVCPKFCGNDGRTSCVSPAPGACAPCDSWAVFEPAPGVAWSVVNAKAPAFGTAPPAPVEADATVPEEDDPAIVAWADAEAKAALALRKRASSLMGGAKGVAPPPPPPVRGLGELSPLPPPPAPLPWPCSGKPKGDCAACRARRDARLSRSSSPN